MPDAIKALLPQREPFLFVDELVSVAKDEIVGIKTYSESFPYYLNCSDQIKLVPGVILIESLVQCGGAGATQQGIAGKMLWGLASIEKARFYDTVELGNTVKMVVKNLRINNRILKQSGVSVCSERVILRANWFCVRL